MCVKNPRRMQNHHSIEQALTELYPSWKLRTG